jgi:SAM-dependent methyltransferase
VLYQRVFLNRQWSLARCGSCRQHFTSPTPNESDLNSFYAGDYHAELRCAGGTEAVFGAKYQRYAEMLARHLSRGRVIDVGCSTGLLVRVLQDRGYDPEGIELNPQSAAWGATHYDVKIRTEPLEKCGFAPASLNAILLTDVLEHTQHPREFLRSAGELLVPGGFVLVTFPDICSIESRYQRMLAKLLRRDAIWKACHIPLHVWEFTRSTAEACFNGAGFRVVEFTRSHLAFDAGGSRALRFLGWPLRLLSMPALARRWGTQMEFVIQKQ